MLNPSKRYEHWERYTERIRNLFSDVEDDLNIKFTPYNTEPDQDTPAVRKLFDMLADITAFAEKHTGELRKEADEWEDEQEKEYCLYEAWENRLCPIVMLATNEWPGNFHLIAMLKHRDGMDRRDTEQAVALWQAQEREALRAMHKAVS